MYGEDPGSDLSFERGQLTYYGISDFSSDDETDMSDHYYNVIPSWQTDRGDDHTGVTCPPPTPPQITRIPVSSRSLAANSIGTDPPTSEFLAGNFRPNHTATCVISNKRGIIPPTPGYLLGDLESDYPVSEVTTIENTMPNTQYTLFKHMTLITMTLTSMKYRVLMITTACFRNSRISSGK